MGKQIKAGIFLQYLQMALSIIINLIYTPIMLNLLGDSEYGLYNLASSIISYLTLLSLGFNASYIRFYSRFKKQGDDEKIKKLNGLFIIFFSAMGLISFVAGMILSFNIGIFFNETYTVNDLQIAKVLMIFLSINLAMSFPASVFGSYIISQEKFIFQKLVNIGKTVISPCLCIAVLYLGYGSIGMVIVTTIVVFIIDIINVCYCFKYLKMRFSFRNIPKGLFKEISIFSLFIALNEIVNQINWQTDKLILGKMISASAVAIYAVASTINTMYMNFSSAISGVFIPRIHKIVNENESDMNKKLTELFIKVGRIQFFVMMLILSGFIIFGKFFLELWTKNTVDYSLVYVITLLLIVPTTVPLIQNVGIEIQRAKNLHKFRSIAYLIMAILNVIISIWFCSMWGIIGTTLGTTISIVISNVIIMNIYYHKKCGINICAFWQSILRAFLGMIIPFGVGVIIIILIPITNIWMFFCLIVIYSLIYCSCIYIFSLNITEKGYIKSILNKIFKKRIKNDKN